MSLEAFSRGKNEGCLSAWQVSQISMGLTSGPLQAHTRSCEVCANRVLVEEKQRTAAVYERVPTVLWAWAGKPSLWVRLRPLFLVLFGAALLGLLALAARWAIVATHKQPLVALSLSVIRGDRLVGQELSVDKPGRLESGDKLRLRVVAQAPRWVRLQAAQGKSWEVYFEGNVPADGWLPTTFTMAPPWADAGARLGVR